MRSLATAWWFYGGATIAVNAWFDNLQDSDALDDLAPTSGFISSTNAQAASEGVGVHRVGIIVDVGGGYNGGPFRLVGSAELSDAAGNPNRVLGLATWNRSLRPHGLHKVCDPHWVGLTSAGFALAHIASKMIDYPWFWNYEIIGGIPSDMTVPSYAMPLPFSTLNPVLIGVAHNQETSHPISTSFMLARLRDMLPQ